MTVRATALRWLALHHRVRDGDIFASRFYPAAESWTGRDAWWINVPVHRVTARDERGDRAFHLLCEVAPNANAFHYLRVPAAFLREHLDAFDRPGDGRVASFFLSAEPDARFRDERGNGVDFAPFLVPDRA